MAKKKTNVTTTSRRNKVSQRSRDFYDPMQAASDLESLQYTDVSSAPSIGQAASPGGMPMMGGGKSSSGGGAISFASGSQDRSRVKQTGSNCRMVNGQMVCGYGPTTTGATTVTSSQPAAASVPITPMPSVNASDEEIEAAAKTEYERANAAKTAKEQASRRGDYTTQNVQGGEQESATIRADRIRDLPLERKIIDEAIKRSQAESRLDDAKTLETDANTQLIREGTGVGRAESVDAMTAKLIDPSNEDAMSMIAYVEGRSTMAANTYNQPNIQQNADGTTTLLQPQNPAEAGTVTENSKANFRRQGIAALQTSVVLSSVTAYNHLAPEMQMVPPDKSDKATFDKFSKTAANKIATGFAASGQLNSPLDVIESLIEAEVYDPMLKSTSQLAMDLNAEKLAGLDAFDAENGTKFAEVQRRELKQRSADFAERWKTLVMKQVMAKSSEIGGSYPDKPDADGGGYFGAFRSGVKAVSDFLNPSDSQAAQQPDTGELTPNQRDELEREREREMRRQEPNVMLAPDLSRRRRAL